MATDHNLSIKKDIEHFLINHGKSDYRIIENHELILFRNKIPVNLYILSPKGFIVSAEVHEKTDILAYSFEHNFANKEQSELYNLSLSLIKDIIYHEIEEPVVDSTEKGTSVLYGPYVHTMWGQVNCHDINGHLINVTNIFTPNHYAPGCVAVSQGTIMHHYRWPPKGVGEHTYTDNLGNSTGTYSAHFGETEYKMNLAKERYRGKASTIEEREAAGEIVYHCAVALNMNFESNGSTSNVNKIPYAFAHYFRFTSLYRNRTSTNFWPLLDSNMVYKKPAVLAVKNSSGGGHSVVCDGLKIENKTHYYHLNMGWWGTSNGWYKIRGSFDAGGYNYVLGAAMNIIPEPMIIPPEIWNDSVEFDLKWRYPEKAEAQAFQVQKSINNGSWITISDTLTDTTLHMVVDPEKEYRFRVRAKTNGKWYLNSWSTVEKLKRKYVSIKENLKAEFTLYPNPFQEYLKISISQKPTFPTIVNILNSSGQIVKNLVITSSSGSIIDTQELPNGFYFIQISNKKHKTVLKAIKY